MGLDMFLDAKLYLSEFREDNGEREKILEMFPEIKLTGNVNYVELRFQAGYWRKANAIHAWFCNNIMDGVDDARPMLVSRDDLKELRHLC